MTISRIPGETKDEQYARYAREHAEREERWNTAARRGLVLCASCGIETTPGRKDEDGQDYCLTCARH